MAKYNAKGYRKSSTGYALYPLIVVLVLIPFIVRMHTYETDLDQYAWFLNQKESVDLFLYWKSVAITLIGVVLAVLTPIRFRKENISLAKNKWMLILIIYSVLVIVSTLTSEFSSYGFSGIYEQFESLWVVLAYCLIALYSYVVIKKDSDLVVMRKALFILLSVMGVIGLTQLIGMDFFESSLGRVLIAPAVARDGLVFNFSGSGTHQVYLTLYNPNYVGVFAALLVPIAIMFVFSTEKLTNRLSWLGLVVISMLCTLGSGSKSFILSFAAILVLAVFFCRKLIIRYWKLVLPIGIAIVLVGGLYFGSRGLNLFQYVKNALVVQEDDFALENFEVTKDCFEVTYNGEKLNISYAEVDGMIYYFLVDEQGKEIDLQTLDNGKVFVNDERFQDIAVGIYQGNELHPYFVGITINDGLPILFTKNENGYQYVNSCLRYDEINPAEASIFANRVKFASGRGYIWSRTIPLLKETILLGTGADSFSLVFPHDDYVMRYNAGYHTSIITRPHNMYLQIAVQHGVLALVCYLAVCLIYFLQSCKLYWKADITKSRSLLGIGIMLGVVGYLIAGMANDSSITVAPLFWLWLGIGFAVNRMNKETAE